MLAALILALASAYSSNEPVSPCAVAIADHEGRNTLELGIGAKACEEELRIDDAAFLGVLARIRASADFILLPPEDVLELTKRTDFRDVFAQSGKFVAEDIARDPDRFAVLLDRVREADLSLPDNYDPSWSVSDDNKLDIYDEVVDGLRTDTLAMESYVAMLVRDDTYFTAYAERVAILEALSESRSQLPERFHEVSKIMRARVDVLGDPPTETAVLWRKVYKPGPNASFTVLHIGFNGAVRGEAKLLRSPSEVRDSWISDALSQDELSQILSEIDFNKEVLALYAVGEMPNATDGFFVTEFGAHEDFEGHGIAVRVGVAGEHCGFEPGLSYPFVLVKAVSEAEGGLSSHSRANYPDQCAPVMTEQPTPVARSE